MISAVPLWRETKASLLPSGTSMVLVKPSLSSQNGRTGSISFTKRTGVIFLTMGISPFGVRRRLEPKDKGVETEPRIGVKFELASGESKANTERGRYGDPEAIARFDFGGTGDVAGF